LNRAPRQDDFDWATRRVLVTGANGFIGRWLVPALIARGATVLALVNVKNKPDEKQFGDAVQVVQGEVTNIELISSLLRDSQIDTVYNLAAINTNTGSSISPYDIFETNTRGAYTVLEACRKMSAPVRAIVFSSKEVEDCFRPDSGRRHHPYMASKAAAEMIARAYFDAAGISTAVVRLENIYGGGDLNWNRLVPGMMRVILRGETPVIRSNGLLQRDYVYVEDLVAACLAIGERLDYPEVRGQLFRIATGRGTTVREMVKQIALAAGRPDLEPKVLNEKTEERIDTLYTPELEREILGWSAKASLPEGLSRACRWYQDFLPKNRA
jgi:CDP-glucose 4,6-dehydratase